MNRKASRAAALRIIPRMAVLAVLAACTAPATGRASTGETLGLLGSARSAAMSTGVATGGGITGMQENMSSLASQTGWAVSGTWLGWLDGAQVGQLSACAPTPAGVVGLSVGGFTAGRVDILEDTGPVRTVDAQRDTVASAGIARNLAFGIDVGIAGKWYRSALAETWVATASALDAGARFTSADGNLTMGGAVGNAVATPLRYADERRVLPRTVAAGAAWRPVRVRGLGILLAVDYVAAAGGPDAHSAGAEVRLMEMLALRAGIRQGGDTTTLSAGIGATWRRLQFDYAVATPAGLGTVSRATMTVGF